MYPTATATATREQMANYQGNINTHCQYTLIELVSLIDIGFTRIRLHWGQCGLTHVLSAFRLRGLRSIFCWTG